VGPLAHVASAEERRGYLSLADDEAAAEFIQEFWERRGPNRAIPPSGPKITYEERAEEADRRFTEGVHLGRRTDRGTVFILYGSPTSIDFASAPRPDGEPVEVWSYPKSAPEGLDGEQPDRRYAFRRDGAVTRVFPLAGVRRFRPASARGRDLG
jgi:GWxTD domain-containing protein